MCDNIEATQSYQSLLSSTTNTRDLGGFPISAGRWTQRNRIWRSDAPVVFCETDEQRLKNLNITTIIDLRTDSETERRPCAYAGRPGFTYQHFPITAGKTYLFFPSQLAVCRLIHWKKYPSPTCRLLSSAKPQRQSMLSLHLTPASCSAVRPVRTEPASLLRCCCQPAAWTGSSLLKTTQSVGITIRTAWNATWRNTLRQTGALSWRMKPAWIAFWLWPPHTLAESIVTLSRAVSPLPILR